MKRYFAAALLLSACQPDSPATTPPPTPPAGSTRAATAAATDTLQLYDSLGRAAGVAQLQPSTAAAFTQLRANDPLPDRPSDAENATMTSDAPLPTDGRVQRRGELLVLRPTQGPVVTLRPVPSPDGPEGNDNAYLYWGSLPTAHQWVIDVFTDQGPATLLVDQRTGRRTSLLGRPSASPDRRYLLSVCEDIGSGSNPTNLSVYRCGPDALTLIWTRDLVEWGPRQARWRDARRVVLEQAHPSPGGDVLATPPPLTYAELELPATPY